MLAWKIALAAALPVTACVLCIISFIFCLCKVKRSSHAVTSTKHPSRFHRSVVCFGNENPVELALRNSTRVAALWRTTYPIKQFTWNEHPALVAEAIDHGWATFGFTHSCSACPMSSSLWDLCTGCLHGIENEAEISWGMGIGSDYRQKLRLNPKIRTRRIDSNAIVQAIQTTLPYPGPPLSPRPFPQVGYYEISVLAESGEHHLDSVRNSFNENEHVKLISKQSPSEKGLSPNAIRSYAEDVIQNTISLVSGRMARDVSNKANPKNLLDGFEMSNVEKMDSQARSQSEQSQVLAIGLASGVAPPFRLPGCDPGSVGLHSNGRVYLNGMLQFEQDSKSPIFARKWGYVNTIVGCGFDPATKKIFFTLNGEIVHELTATSPEFACPLYPTIASNYDVTLLANFGQTAFEYNAANSYRMPDPCLKPPLSKSSKNGFVKEDSGDLFSMGRIDAQWLGEIDSPISDDVQHRHAPSEAESDLFEIVLDG